MAPPELLEDIFEPEMDAEIVDEVQKLKEKLNSRQISATFFTMVLDAKKNNGKICRINNEDDDEDTPSLTVDT